MLIVLSPAKSLDFTPAAPGAPLSTPQLKDDIAALAKVTRKLKRSDLKQLMSISEKLADLNYQRFQAFDEACEEGLQAAMAFDGDVYDGLQARTLDKAALGWAQDHLRILSGLYGVLRPLDAIQPYRLEMGIRLKNPRGATLYDFWKGRVAPTLNAVLETQAEPALINLASQEYFGAVDVAALKAPVITCHFKEIRPGEAPRILSFYAKKARGLMARYAIEHRLERAEQLRAFDTAGYVYQADLSTDTDWIFCRPHPLA
ncbi:MAG: peroxide stress protein YaaA [Caulobacteraceae bacterium]|nr:peroxide stress protein YaaA [Caulobacteraceae bacterium]